MKEEQKVMKTKFYRFYQNNSGGIWDLDSERGIAVNVYIEAETADQANRKAEQIGIYFYGCDSGTDCHCCGDRWYETSSYDAYDREDIVYYDLTKEIKLTHNTKLEKGYLGAKPGEIVAIHCLDGTIEKF